MNALEYLRDVPVLWQNIERATVRREQFDHSTRPLFTDCRMFTGDDGSAGDLYRRARTWRDLVVDGLSRDTDDLFTRAKDFRAQDDTLHSRPKLQLLYSRTLALYDSSVRMLKYGIEMGWERFIVAEDDAVPRRSLLEQTLPPPADTDLVVWAGAQPMGSFSVDDVAFRRGAPPQWRVITKPKNLFISTVYEVTRSGARQLLHDYLDRPHATDITWWYTMQAVPSVVLRPMGFAQHGESLRKTKGRVGQT